MSPATLRLFFALCPDDAARAALAALAREIGVASGGRATAASLLHLTLAFLGVQTAERVPALQDLASAIDARAFVLALDEIGCFRTSGVAWLGASAPPPELAALQGALARALEREGFPVDARPYAPHLTLARRIRRQVHRMLAEPVVWTARSFTLVASETLPEGPRYRRLAEWALRPV